MLDVALSHVLRRSLESPHFTQADPPADLIPTPGNDDNKDLFRDVQVSTPAIVTIAFTLLVFCLVLASLRYTLWMVVTTLASVEEPRTVLQVDNAPKPPTGDADLEVAQINRVAITSSIRATLRHLTERAGWTSRWRGLSLFICYSIVYAMLNLLTTAILGQVLGDLFGALVASLALARWGTAWVHIVISEPSQKSWFRRVPDWKATRNVALPTFVSLVAAKAVTYSLYSMSLFWKPEDWAEQTRRSPYLALAKFLLVGAVMLTVFVTISLPASVALYRVQASMLPEEDESIVPFDRSFSGKVKPAITGGSGALSFVDAWKSFDIASRNRMLKLVGKLFAIEVGLNLLFGLVLASEVAIFIGTKGIKEAPSDP